MPSSLVLPGHWRALAIGVVLGCKATVKDLQTGKILEASGVLDFGQKRGSVKRR